jgi:general secretion pathway protein C
MQDSDMPRYISIFFNLFAIGVITFVVVDIFYKIVKNEVFYFETSVISPVRAPERSGKPIASGRSYRAIVDRNLFGASGIQEETKVEDIELANLEPTTLQVRLLGTIAGDEPSARAIIEDLKNREQSLYRVGDTIQEATVSRILRGKVILRVDNHDEILTMDEADAASQQVAAPVSGRRAGRATRSSRAASSTEAGQSDSFTLDQQEIAESLSDISSILTQVKVEPYMEDGVAQGLRVSEISSDSIFQRIGLIDGDIVQAVNRKKISSPDDVVSLYQTMKTASRFSLQVTRDGQQKILNYNIR